MTNGPERLRRWPALVGGGLLNVAIGTYYGWSVFVPPLEREFGWTRTQLSLVATIDMVMLASTFLLAGFIMRRVGPRPVAFFGGVMFSLGLFLASFTSSLLTLYLTWGLMIGMGLGFGYLTPITVGALWFPYQRGLVNGLAIGIFAAGSGIFGPLAAALLERVGWRETFQILAGIFFAFTMVGAYLLKDPPPDYQALPPERRQHASTRKVTPPDVATRDIVRSPMFYRVWIAYALGSAAGTMVISQLVPFARSGGLSANVAAFAITIGAIGSASGRFLSGWMSDHFGRLFTLRAIILISTIATPSLYVWREQVWLFYILLFVVYYCYGTQISVYTALTGDYYGTKYLSTNYGLLLLAWGFAGVLGPLIGSQVFVATGNYRVAFFGAGALAFAALALLMLIEPPKPVRDEAETGPALHNQRRPALSGRSV